MLSLKRSWRATGAIERGSGPMILTETAKILTQPNGKVTPDIKMAAIRLTQLALLQGARNPGSDQIGHTLLAGFPAGSTGFDAETARILAVLNLRRPPSRSCGWWKRRPITACSCTTRSRCVSQFRLDVRPKAATARLVRRDARLGGRQQPNGLRLQYRWGHDRAFHSGRPQIFRGAGAQFPAAAALLVRIRKPEEIADYQKILGDLLADTSTKNARGSEELVAAAIQSLGKSQSPSGRAMLRRLYDDIPIVAR